ncbi:hypothetical protein RMATCC62417_15815 [Rhizopus microsporus]|nr:hypothetical protein RMATCC62417_15815 [Rhizopus microsporus]
MQKLARVDTLQKVLVETSIPTPKTSNINQYIGHLQYTMLHLSRFFGFYNFRTAQIDWNNYRGRQCVLEEACNILLNGGKKYNRARRKKMRSNRRRRKKMVNRRRQGDNADNPIEIRRETHKSHFNEGDTTKMPLIIFGDGLKGSTHVRLRGRRVGASEMVYKNLKKREKQGELLVLDINEFKTSSVCFECHQRNLKHHTAQERTFYNILICNDCNIFWNLDVLAAKNMMFISTQLWSGNERPNIFSRQQDNAPHRT